MATMKPVCALILLSLHVLVQALVPGGMPPAHAGARTVKHFLEPHPLRYIHIFGSKPPPSPR